MKKRASAKVYCRNNNHGELDFYLEADSKNYYLFTTRYYSEPIFSEYSAGRMVDSVYRSSYSVRHQRLKEYILRMVKYIEMEEEITVLAKPEKKSNKYRQHKAMKYNKAVWKYDSYKDYEYEELDYEEYESEYEPEQAISFEPVDDYEIA